MGRDNPKYKKTLHQQMYERLVSIQAFVKLVLTIPSHIDCVKNFDKIDT